MCKKFVFVSVKVACQIFCLFSWGTPSLSWPATKSFKNQHMPPTNYSHSFIFSAFRLIFLSRFPFKGCLYIAFSLTFLFPMLRLTSAFHHRKGVHVTLDIPLEAQNDEHKSLQTPDKIHNRTMLCCSFRSLFQNMFLTAW